MKLKKVNMDYVDLTNTYLDELGYPAESKIEDLPTTIEQLADYTEYVEQKTRNQDITIAVSGYFTVLHKGHIDLFRNAKKLGNKLVVIINNEQQQIAKKGKLIHDPKEIAEIIKEFECVDEVIVSIDEDKTVCKTLEFLKPNVFANGGDRNKDNVPEQDTCFKIGCKMIYGVGGDKVNSSSNIIENEGL